MCPNTYMMVCSALLKVMFSKAKSNNFFTNCSR